MGLVVVLLAVSTILAAGCAPEQRYRVLSFVFDGVPKPGEEAPQHHRRAEAGPTSDAYLARLRAKNAVKVFQHGPYASKHCPACHVSGKQAEGFYVPGTGGHAPRFGPQLRYTKVQLCRHCHERFRPAVLARRQRYTHGPVAAGACLRCHNPHSTRNRYMIRKRPIRTICLTCHDPKEIFASDYHKAARVERDCTDCHDPHGGTRRYFLRPPPTPPATGGGGRVAGLGRWEERG